MGAVQRRLPARPPDGVGVMAREELRVPARISDLGALRPLGAARGARTEGPPRPDERDLREGETMKALTWQGNHDVSVEEVPDPKIERPTDAIIKVTSSGICGSDLHLYEG